MNYLYITLYYFYTKILFVHRDYPPIISITAVLSMFIMFLIMTLIEVLNFQYLYEYKSSKYILMFLYLLGWYIFYEYYITKEKHLIKRFKKLKLLTKGLVFLFSTIFILVLIIVWFNRFKYFRYDWN